MFTQSDALCAGHERMQEHFRSVREATDVNACRGHLQGASLASATVMHASTLTCASFAATRGTFTTVCVCRHVLLVRSVSVGCRNKRDFVVW